MNYDFIVIGGGVAGLCAAIRLTELGAHTIVIEAGTYPSHKICGEFCSADSLPILKQWGITPIEITKTFFHTPSDSLEFKLPTASGGLSHWTLDPFLASKTNVMKETLVKRLYMESDIHHVILSSGEEIRAPNVIVASGRVASNKKMTPAYTAFKAHFTGDIPNDTLQMFFIDGAYAGISPIEEGKFNVAGICVPGKTLEDLREKNRAFDKLLLQSRSLFSEWMTAELPEYGIKETPDWMNAYFIGDAAGSIPPITGNGLTLAITGGIMAAEYGMRGDYKGFKKAWNEHLKARMFWGKSLHFVVMREWMAKCVKAIASSYPGTMDYLYHKTR